MSKIVIAGIIEREDKKILIAPRKGKPLELDGLYEFPGGKIESGETPEGCLERELWEEGHIKVAVGEFFHKNIHNYPFGVIELSAYWAKIISGEFKSKVHYGPKWVDRFEMRNYIFCPADVPFVEKLMTF